MVVCCILHNFSHDTKFYFRQIYINYIIKGYKLQLLQKGRARPISDILPCQKTNITDSSSPLKRAAFDPYQTTRFSYPA